MKHSTRLSILVSFFFVLLITADASAMMHPRLGRFIQRDPIGYADGMSLYEYVGSGPVAERDPSGKEFYDTSMSEEAHKQRIKEYNRLLTRTIYDKLKLLCEKCWCKADKSCNLSRCKLEAYLIAKAYVKMWAKMANSADSYGMKCPLRTQHDENIHSGWLCYHWRTHTYNALLPEQGHCFKVAKSGWVFATDSDDILIHNWVVVTIGKEAQATGDCTVRFDPWLEEGPNIYTDAEHAKIFKQLHEYDLESNFFSTTPNDPGEHTGIYTDKNGIEWDMTYKEEYWLDAKPYSP